MFFAEAQRQRVGRLKDHADLPPEVCQFRRSSPVEVGQAAVEEQFYAAFRAAAGEGLVEPVERAQQRRFAGAGAAQQHCDALLRQLQRDVFERLGAGEAYG